MYKIKSISIVISMLMFGLIAKGQEIKIEQNKILSVDKIAEIKGDTLFIYKDLDKALEMLNKSKNHKPFKYVVILQQTKDKNNIYYPNLFKNGAVTLAY